MQDADPLDLHGQFLAGLEEDRQHNPHNRIDAMDTYHAKSVGFDANAFGENGLMAEERVHRKLAAILAADVVGYSRLMREDEEATHAALTSHLNELIKPNIAEHQGRLVKTTGDGLLAEFPSVVEAIRCATEVQEIMDERNLGISPDRRIKFRIGVNLGDIIVRDDDVYGDGVNVAARLEGLANPGGIWISGSAYEQVRDKVDFTFQDLGDHEVKNIDRPVRAYRVVTETDPSDITFDARPANQNSSLRRVIGIASVLVVALIGTAAWFWLNRGPLTESTKSSAQSVTIQGRPSLAVLPLKNLSGDPAEKFFSDGITEDIISALGRYSSLAVKAYNAAFPYKETAEQAADIGKRLGVRYVVQGSVRRAGPRARVNIKLTDSIRNLLLWSETFDDEQSDVFAIQDAITKRVAGSLVANLKRVEQQRAFAKPTHSLEAYELVLRARARLARATRPSNREARRLFERATELDPNYAAAYAWLARAYYHTARDGWTEFADRNLKRAENYALKSLSIDPDSVEAHRTLGRIYGIRFQLDRAIAEIDQALALNPSYAEAHGDRGLILLWVGRLKEAAESLDTAFVFDPNLPADFVFAHGLAYYSLHRTARAVKILEAGASRYPNFVFIPATLVAAYGQLGRKSEARRNVEKVKSLMPIFEPASFGKRFQNQTHYNYLMEGLRKGGMS